MRQSAVRVRRAAPGTPPCAAPCRGTTSARPGPSREGGGRRTTRACAAAGRATTSTATWNAGRAVGVTAPAAAATSARCAATSSVTVNATRRSLATGRSCAGWSAAIRHGCSIRAALPTCGSTTPRRSIRRRAFRDGRRRRPRQPRRLPRRLLPRHPRNPRHSCRACRTWFRLCSGCSGSARRPLAFDPSGASRRVRALRGPAGYRPRKLSHDRGDQRGARVSSQLSGRTERGPAAVGVTPSGPDPCEGRPRFGNA